MPWTVDDYPNSMKNLDPKRREKAIGIANAILKNGGNEGMAIATGMKRSKGMSLIKLASDKKQGGIAGWTQRHPIMTAGIALTGGIAAADMAIGVRSALKSGKVWHHNLADHAKEGLLYGSVLGATEPAIAHGLMKKPVDQNG